MIYFDVTDLLGRLISGKHLNGIQRLTLNSVVSIAKKSLGESSIALLKFERESRQWMVLGFESFAASVLKNSAARRGTTKESNWKEAHLCSADSFVQMEWFRGLGYLDFIADQKQRHKFKIFQFVHDLTPLARPDYFFSRTAIDFRQCLDKAIASADVVLTNSAHTKSDILKFYPQSPPIKVLPLPHEFIGQYELLERLTASEARKTDRNTEQTAAADEKISQPYVLMVGTVEPRKNTHLVIDLWKLLSIKYGEKLPKLVLVGDFSWLGWQRFRLTFVLFLQRVGRGRIIHLRGCDDQTLRRLYQHCLFTIYLSDYEGWGLPVGESMWLGKTVLAGASTSLPEVGQGLVQHVDPHDAVKLRQCVERLCFDAPYRQALEAVLTDKPLRSWNEFSDELAMQLFGGLAGSKEVEGSAGSLQGL